jgi:hypothetical protein
MSASILSTLDELYESFLQSLPPAPGALGRALPHTLRLSASPEAPWRQAFREPVVPGLPLYLAEGLTGAFPSAVRDAATAHLLGVVAALVTRRLEEGAVQASPELEALRDALRTARDAALERLGAQLPRGVQTDYLLAEQDAAAALAEARELLRQRTPMSVERYERLLLRTQAALFPAPLALASVAGCSEARKRVIQQAVAGLALCFQVRDDALDWEENEARGAAWAVNLMRHHVGGAVPGHPTEVRRLVQGCGVLVRLLERARENFAEVKRAAGWVGARNLERWAAEEERSANMLARTEARSPGHAVQWKARQLAAI